MTDSPVTTSQTPGVTEVNAQTPAPKKSSGLVILGVIALLLVLVGSGVYYFWPKNSASTQTPVTQNLAPVIPVASPVAVVDPLDTDMQNVDKSMGSLDTEVGSADQGLNDKPVDLTP